MTTRLEAWSSPTTRFWRKHIGGDPPYALDSFDELLPRWHQLVCSFPPALQRRLTFVLEDEATIIRELARRGFAGPFELAMLEEFDTWYAPVLPEGTAKPHPSSEPGFGAVLKYHFPAIAAHVLNG